MTDAQRDREARVRRIWELSEEKGLQYLKGGPGATFTVVDELPTERRLSKYLGPGSIEDDLVLKVIRFHIRIYYCVEDGTRHAVVVSDEGFIVRHLR